ncbi:MAG TPA: hypothetical protein VLD39_04200 [Gammaproteobacteria bacterium]|nr:hypothetical protein [Gammaproteobacteria bacterium]
MRASGGLLAAALASLLGACAQPAPEEAAAYAAPRTSFGDPDLQGIWQAMNAAVWNLEDHTAELGIPAGQSVVVGAAIPYRPEALAQRETNRSNRLTDDPEASCKMVGVPRITYMPYPFQIVQTPGQVTMLSEYVHTVRTIYLDSDHPADPIQPYWMGDSRGHWEGDTLVVDVVNFTDQTWLDRSGNFHSDALHAVERYTRTGPDHLLYEVTIEDPQVFTQSWQIRMPLYRRLEDNARILEYECYAYLEETRSE